MSTTHRTKSHFFTQFRKLYPNIYPKIYLLRNNGGCRRRPRLTPRTTSLQIIKIGTKKRIDTMTIYFLKQFENLNVLIVYLRFSNGASSSIAQRFDEEKREYLEKKIRNLPFDASILSN